MSLTGTGLGFLEKVIGFAWKLTKQDQDALRPILALIQGKDVGYTPSSNECCEATYKSVREIRDTINKQLGLPMSFDLAQSLRELEVACRLFMRSMETEGLAFKQYPNGGEEFRKFTSILAQFQQSVQDAVRRLADQYKIIMP